jgi:hypothetical protein
MGSIVIPSPVNILMVDDQPSKLLSYEVMLSELGRKSVVKRPPAARLWECWLKNGLRGRSDGTSACRARWIRTRRNDSSASSISKDRYHFYLSPSILRTWIASKGMRAWRCGRIFPCRSSRNYCARGSVFLLSFTARRAPAGVAKPGASPAIAEFDYRARLRNRGASRANSMTASVRT